LEWGNFYFFEYTITIKIAEKNDKEVDQLKRLISEALFNNNELIQAGLKMHLGLFHYKRLTRSILRDFDKAKLSNKSAEFRAQIDKRKREYLRIAVEPSVSLVQNACRFYKTLMRLKRDEILAQSVEWHAYFRFRMRHFYWIDDKVGGYGYGAKCLPGLAYVYLFVLKIYISFSFQKIDLFN
jgi:hypothetical protein